MSDVEVVAVARAIGNLIGPEPAGLSPTTVGAQLLAAETRGGALDALDAHVGAHDLPFALAAATALTDVLCLSAHEVGRTAFRRAGLLRGRLALEAADPAPIFGAAHSDGRLMATYESADSVVGQLLRKPPAQLGREDVIDYACMAAMAAPAYRYGCTRPLAAASTPGRSTVPDFFKILGGFARTEGDDGVCLRLAELVLELVSEPQQHSDLVVAGAWTCLNHCCNSRYNIGRHITDSCSLFDVAATNLRAVGGVGEWLSGSRGRGGRAGAIFYCIVTGLKARAGETERPDVDAFVESGMFEAALAGIRTFAAADAAGIADTDPAALLLSLASLRQYAHLPAEQQAQLCGEASGLAFAMAPENCRDWFAEAGLISDSYAGQVCAAVFGRDEADGSKGFVFTQSQVNKAALPASRGLLHTTWCGCAAAGIRRVSPFSVWKNAQVDLMLVRWHCIVSKAENGAYTKLSSDAIQTLELCIADANKPLLLANADFVPYLLECLLLDPSHPQLVSGWNSSTSWLQQMASECFAQLAMFPAGCTALRQDAARVRPALTAVTSVEHGRSPEARKFVRAALTALFPEKQQRPTSPLQGASLLAPSKHVMLSYNWEFQMTIKRLNLALKARGYNVWIDVEKMQGSTIEAMADAVEQSAVMCYAVSQSCERRPPQPLN